MPLHRERTRTGVGHGRARRERIAARVDPTRGDVGRAKILAGNDTFGVAVAVAAYLLYVPMFFADVSFARWPNIAEYMGRCCARPAYARAFGVETAAALAERAEGWAATE